MLGWVDCDFMGLGGNDKVANFTTKQGLCYNGILCKVYRGLPLYNFSPIPPNTRL